MHRHRLLWLQVRFVSLQGPHQSQVIGDPQAAGAGHLVFPEQTIVLYLQMWKLLDATQIDIVIIGYLYVRHWISLEIMNRLGRWRLVWLVTGRKV